MDKKGYNTKGRGGGNVNEGGDGDKWSRWWWGLSHRKSAPSEESSNSNQVQRSPSQSKSPKQKIRISSRSDKLPFYYQNWFLVLLTLMSLSCFAFALFVFLYLYPDSIESSPSSTSPASSEVVEITYGTVLKLMHEKTKFRLHSHEVPYGSGSGQQSVTGFPDVEDSNSYWIIRPQPGTSAKQGDPIKSGTIIKLQHMRTRRWLHSHWFSSPISGNQEVSCFGGDSESDTGDLWRLLIEGSGNIWRKDQRIRLQHADTGVYLHSHNKKYSRIAGGQQEVCGVQDKRAENIWLAAEGVYLPVNGSE
ncbi:hypothetical protein Nepgr_008898 [Nepenthes gracilis]|uniref:MIR domain-containing protein n=1 Tax=Nepenthes gracilis TaxID=150966 RepID=A0AAD3S9T1_NEPGR|nr:hypothetical protein Nepgr_008898 [Nepenthes gracilis]